MKLTLNLASRRYVNKRALNYAFSVIMCLLLLFVGWTLQSLIVDYRGLQLNQQGLLKIEQQLVTLGAGRKKVLSGEERERVEQRFVLVKQLLKQDAFRWTELLDRMEELLPAGVSLSGFRPDYTKKSLAINGRARSLKQMRIFLDRLLKVGSFEQVYLRNHSRILLTDAAGQERSAIAFSLQLEGVF